MDRSNHYESAFEAYLRERRYGYIAVDEAHRSTLDDEPVKSLDFVVYGPHGAKLLVDVKGRRYPGGTKAKPRHVWQSWSTRGDIDALERWAERFGNDYVGLLVFVYRIGTGFALPEDTPDVWTHRNRSYLLRAVAVDDYRKHMRTRSPKWDTVGLRTADFRDVVRPFADYATVGDAAPAEVADELPNMLARLRCV